MFKKCALFLFFFCLSFCTLSLRLGELSLFNHLDQFTYPLAQQGLSYGEKLIEKSYNHFLTWNAKKREGKNPSLTMTKNRFGHQTYSAQEKEQLLELLSGAVQKNN